jgi:COP9 signalosome complex subunit 12
LSESRKWGIYSTTNLLFKTYFKLNSIALSKNVLRALQASSTDLPDLALFPRSHRVTFKYYRGVIAFLEESYAEAEEHLTAALAECLAHSLHNRALILTYLIPCHMLTTHTLPTQNLLTPFPQLTTLFAPLCTAIRRGDLAAFDAALAAGEPAFVRRRIYLTLERGRDIALRNLFRRVFLAGGFEETSKPDGAADPVRRTRIPVLEFAAAMRIRGGPSTGGGGAPPSMARSLDLDEVECMLANLIYKGLMKGYIARERGIVVLSKGGAFPGTGV